MRMLRELLADDSAVSMTEYAIIISLLSAACMAALVAIANSANTSLSSVAAKTQAYQVASPP